MKLPPLWWQAVKPLLPESTFGSRESTINNYSVAAVHELVHDLRDDRAQEAVVGLKTLFVGGKKGVDVPGQALPEGRGAGFAGPVGLHLPRGICSSAAKSYTGSVTILADGAEHHLPSVRIHLGSSPPTSIRLRPRSTKTPPDHPARRASAEWAKLLRKISGFCAASPTCRGRRPGRARS